MEIKHGIAGGFALLTAFALGLGASALVRDPPAAPAVSLAEVSDLIDRLRPIVKAGDKAWYENGLSLTFYGNKSVKLELKLPDRSEYHSRADTLRDAVSRITQPSVDIQNAVRGWGGQ